MKSRWIGLAAGVFALALVAAPAAAQMHGHRHGGTAGIPLPMILHSANLTSAQREKVHAIMKSQFATLKPLMAQLKAGRDAVAKAYLAPGNVTAAKLQPLVTANEKTQSEIDKAFLDTAIQIRGVLTAEQIAHAGSVYSQMQSLHEQMRKLMWSGEGQSAMPMPMP